LGNGGAGGALVVAVTALDAASATRVAGGSCGDGILEGNEQCDDGVPPAEKTGPNAIDTGCNALCQVEANWNCQTPGQPCQYVGVCGNGVLTSNKQCDDGNAVSGDGCSSTCKLEPGWVCRVPGKPCSPLCGDGLVVGNEQCDDGNTVSGDGCSPTCKIEPGWKCTGAPSVCTKTVCGNGIVETGEGCDDGNALPFDGCSENCQVEPTCPADGSPCTSPCGDGLVMGSKQCDDGNQTSGDGCSSTCQVEAGWACTQPPLGNKMVVPILYRDFRFHNPTDFEPGVTGQYAATLGIAASTLDQDGKPQYAAGLAAGYGHIAGASTFSAWFRTSTSGLNYPIGSTLALWQNSNGAYVNRYGPNGEQWTVTTPANWCGSVGQELTDAAGNPIPCTFEYQQSDADPTGGQTDCQKMEALGYTQLPGSCKASGGTYSAEYIVKTVDGNPLFFPIDDSPFTPTSEFHVAQVPSQSQPADLYDDSGDWPYDVDSAGNKRMHNFSFTSEVRYWFTYDPSKTFELDFVGDDDVWVFVDKKLAVDLGGIHTPVQGSVTLDSPTIAKLGLNLKSGSVYEAAVFQVERQTTCSTYELTLNGFNSSPSVCSSPCGNGVVVGNKECDCGNGTVPVPAGCPGANSDTAYGGCTTQCQWGPFCGDGIVQSPQEECDLGKENGDTSLGKNGCSFTCKKPHFCGDGTVDTDLGEQCDMGSLNGVAVDASGNPSSAPDAQVLCTIDCTIPPGAVL
jgi:fibro-slime domain-containing protein